MDNAYDERSDNDVSVVRLQPQSRVLQIIPIVPMIQLLVFYVVRNDKPSINVEKEFDCYVSTADLLRPKKKTKSDHLSAVSLGFMWGRNGSKKPKDLKQIKILFDSGCSATK